MSRYPPTTHPEGGLVKKATLSWSRSSHCSSCLGAVLTTLRHGLVRRRGPRDRHLVTGSSAATSRRRERGTRRAPVVIAGKRDDVGILALTDDVKVRCLGHGDAGSPKKETENGIGLLLQGNLRHEDRMEFVSAFRRLRQAGNRDLTARRQRPGLQLLASRGVSATAQLTAAIVKPAPAR